MATKREAVLKEGDPAPEIRLPADSGKTFLLSDLKGKTVVLYFYPKANTPGCTAEACEFRDLSREFARAGAEIVGISPDTAGPQAKFRAKFDLPFTLLCDADKEAAAAYGVWKEKTMYGRKVMGIERSTFIVGPDGRIRKIFARVKAQGHAAQALETLKNLQ